MSERDPKKLYSCQVCGEKKRLRELTPGEMVRPALVALLRRDCPSWSSDGYICFSDLNRYRTEYIRETLMKETGELSQVQREVLESMQEQELLARNLNVSYDKSLTFGERLADKVAEFGGSWTFIIFFGLVLVGWITVNTIGLMQKPYDPYPYILLNLLLSCLAAIQAPIIMMSQNRQEAKDRLRSEEDYKTNLKAELEIRQLHTKLDLLMSNHWVRLMEVQDIQLELMEELAEGKQGAGGC